MYLRRQRQSLLWKLLLDEVIESLPALPGDGVAELKRARRRSDGRAAPTSRRARSTRVLALGALVGDATPEGMRFRWAE